MCVCGFIHFGYFDIKTKKVFKGLEIRSYLTNEVPVFSYFLDKSHLDGLYCLSTL